MVGGETVELGVSNARFPLYISSLDFNVLLGEPLIMKIMVWVICNHLNGVLKTEFFPVTRRFFFPCDQINCGKLIVEYDVELGSNTTGCNVQELRHFTGVLVAQAHEYSLTRMRLLSWQFLPLLHLWVEDIGGTTAHMRIH
jgi:hypothetical protein